MHFGLLGDLIENSQRFGIVRISRAQCIDSGFHGCVEVVPPRFVGQGEVAEQFEAMAPDRLQVVMQESHGGIVGIEGCPNCGGRVFFSPNGIRKGEMPTRT